MTNTARKLRKPYDANRAVLPADESISNARNYGGEKELVHRLQAVAYDRTKQNYDGSRFYTPLDARFWMGRSNNASVVYCSVWVRTKDGRHMSGKGTAGGYGYHKVSAAFDAAARSAEIQLDASVSGCGDGPMRLAAEAIVRAAGYTTFTIVE